jgi:hypothetical protein
LHPFDFFPQTIYNSQWKRVKRQKRGDNHDQRFGIKASQRVGKGDRGGVEELGLQFELGTVKVISLNTVDNLRTLVYIVNGL